MAIPDYQTVMLPILELVSDGQPHFMRDVTSQIADKFGLTVEERQQRLPSGQETIINNRVGWSRSHLKMAGLLEIPNRGYVRITSLGKDVLDQKPARIDQRFLRQYPAYLDFVNKSRSVEQTNRKGDEESTQTPKELIDNAYKTLRNALAKELLDKVMAASPRFFEETVVKLLVAMGYGGTLADAGQRIGGPGDGGIDGIIKEDRLGLDIICIQAKRWQGNVGRPSVQGFVGSMEDYRAKKGVMITTSSFTNDARVYVSRIEGKKVVLIDGEMLTELMIDYNVGVQIADSYQVKRVDYDFFSEEED